MTQININILLQNFFNRNPDIKKVSAKKIVNRRALAKYIIEEEKLNKNMFEALITALRRFEIKPEKKESLNLFKEIKVSTKDNLSRFCSPKVIAKSWIPTNESDIVSYMLETPSIQ